MRLASEDDAYPSLGITYEMTMEQYRNILYICVKLDDKSKNALKTFAKDVFGDDGCRRYFCDHLTLAFGRQCELFNMDLIGTKVKLKVDTIAYDDKIAAAVKAKHADDDAFMTDDDVGLADVEVVARQTDSSARGALARDGDVGVLEFEYAGKVNGSADLEENGSRGVVAVA